jgi:hypothetical protein
LFNLTNKKSYSSWSLFVNSSPYLSRCSLHTFQLVTLSVKLLVYTNDRTHFRTYVWSHPPTRRESETDGYFGRRPQSTSSSPSCRYCFEPALVFFVFSVISLHSLHFFFRSKLSNCHNISVNQFNRVN